MCLSVIDGKHGIYVKKQYAACSTMSILTLLALVGREISITVVKQDLDARYVYSGIYMGVNMSTDGIFQLL